MAALSTSRQPLEILRHILTGWLPLLILFFAQAAAAQGAEEYALKAAFIHNFTFFIEWPSKALPQQEGFFSVCLWKSDPSGGIFGVFEERHYKELPIRVVRVNSIQEIVSKPCHILFVPDPSKDAQQLKELADAPVLTVCDLPSPECIIELHLVERKVRFKIRHQKAKQASLVVRAQLLQLGLQE